MEYPEDLKTAANKKKEFQGVLKKLRRTKPKDLDDTFHDLHDQVFSEIDCLRCANCCSTTSPIFLQSDIERLAKVCKMKVSVFIETYLKVDEEGDYVLQSSPCAFLGADNKCIVYESRPKACREYPHTNRKRMYQITSLTYKNSLMCPAVSRIMTEISNIYS